MKAHRLPRRCHCGSLLARDNQDAQCAACQAKARDLLREPPTVPDEFWLADPMADALATWHMGRVVAAYRSHPFHGRPLRQEIVASWVGITQAQLSRIENGSALKDLDKLTYWARTLGIPGHLLWFKLPDSDRDQAEDLPAGSEIQVRSAMARQPAPGSRTRGHMSAVLSFRAADRQVGGGHLYETVIKYLGSEVAPKLVAVEDDTAFHFTAAAAVTEMAGWMAHDAGRDKTAERHFTRSLDLVKLGSDRQLSVHILASLSHLAHHSGQPDKAMQLAQRGQLILYKIPRQPELEARLLAMQARGYAAHRQSGPSQQLLGQAERALTQAHAEAPSPWVSPFDEASLANETARCLLQLGDYRSAERQAERILDLRTGDCSRSRAFAQLILVTSLIAQKRIDEACALAQAVLHATPQLGSLVILRQLFELKEQFASHRSNSLVAEFLSHLTESLSQRQWLDELAEPAGHK